MRFRKKMDAKFKSYAQECEKFAEKYGYDIEFDIPYIELGFYGCHNKSSVIIYPSKNSLVSLSESPFFAMDV